MSEHSDRPQKTATQMNVAAGLVPTGVQGLDDIFGGGMPAGRVYLFQGAPGAGKTTLGMQFLMEGARSGEKVLYVSLSETYEELEAIAVSHGWDLTGVTLFELAAAEKLLAEQERQSVFKPSEIELSELMNTLCEKVEEVQPTRLVLDGLSELRLLASGSLAFRKQILLLKRHFGLRDVTIILLDDNTIGSKETQLRSIAHGVLAIDQQPPAYGPDRRRLRILKVRGHHFRHGYHDCKLLKGGMEAFPRLVAAEHRQRSISEQMCSGIARLDALMGGGLDRGASTLLIGPPGAGKSSTGCTFAAAAAQRGQKVAVYLFDERPQTYIARAEALGMPLQRLISEGAARVQQVDPTELTPGEFAQQVREHVEEGVQIVVFDSINGYVNAMSGGGDLVLQLRELLSFLGQQWVATLLVLGSHSRTPSQGERTLDVTYLADNVLLFRYYEEAGEIKKAVMAFKRRTGVHDRRLFPLSLSEAGIELGAPLETFSGLTENLPAHLVG